MVFKLGAVSHQSQGGIARASNAYLIPLADIEIL
jgi:hypothetical protein